MTQSKMLSKDLENIENKYFRKFESINKLMNQRPSEDLIRCSEYTFKALEQIRRLRAVFERTFWKIVNEPPRVFYCRNLLNRILLDPNLASEFVATVAETVSLNDLEFIYKLFFARTKDIQTRTNIRN